MTMEPSSTETPVVLPPRQQLARLIRSLGRRLPVQCAGLLSDPRFAEGRGALARLANDAHLTSAVGALADAEAAWMVDLLYTRWCAVGDAVLEPMAAVVAPAEVWVGSEPVRLAVEAAVAGTDPGWEVAWDGVASASGARAVVVVEPNARSVAVRVHVRARAESERVALTAAARIAVRRPSITVRQDRRRLVVVDQLGAPAIGVTVRVGDAEYQTGAGGLLDLDQPAPRGADLFVQGIRAGRISFDT
jgi:hypothetical protein